MVAGVLAVVIALGIGMYQSDASQKGPRLSPEEVKSFVLSQYPGTITELELERDDNRAIYEIEIVKDNMEYELKVDGNSGEILKLKEKLIDSKEVAKKETEKEKLKIKEDKENESKKDDDQKHPETKVESKEAKQEKQQVQQQKQPEQKQQKQQVKETKQTQPKQQVQQKQKSEPKKQQPSKPKQEKKQTIISQARAIEIALAEFPGKVDDVELDDDDGRLIYEIEIENGDREAEFEIDAMTGKILVIEIDD